MEDAQLTRVSHVVSHTIYNWLVIALKRTLQILCWSCVLLFFITVRKNPDVSAIPLGDKDATRTELLVTNSGSFWKLYLGCASSGLTCG